MKTVTLDLVSVSDERWDEPRGIVSNVLDEPVPGFLRQVALGAAGVTVRVGRVTVGIPLSELLRVAQEAEPALAPPAPVAPEPPAE